MKKVLVFIFILFALTFIPKNIFAKVLPQALKAGKTTTKTVSSGINVAVNLRADRRAVNVNFSNLQNAKSVSYSLTYSTSDQDEGAMGAINFGSSSTAFQEILLGTCSKGVCRYHTGVKNVKLEVSYTTKEGKKYIKRFRIKV
jgi:hypothetical protein